MGKKKHKPLPPGMTYAEKLAQEKMVKEAVEKAARDHMVKTRAEILAQRDLWLQIVSIGKAFGVGQKRIWDYFDTFATVTEEFNDMTEKHGQEYALEKLRQEAEKLTGVPLEYLYEKEFAAARERNEARGVFFSVIEEGET